MSAAVAVLLVALGSAAGAVCRHLLDRAVQRRGRPSSAWGTWAVNVTGSFAIGLLAGWTRGSPVPDELVLASATGFLGSYTTFSTFAVQVIRPDGRRPALSGALTAAASITAGLLAAWAGLALTGG